MKHFLLILAAALAVSGCNFVMGPGEPDSPALTNGNLSITFGNAGASSGPQSREITSGADLPEDVLAAMRYDLTLSGPNGEVLGETVSGGGTHNLTLIQGLWRIDVIAWQDAEARAGTGSLSFTVEPGNNSVRIPINMDGPCYEIELPEGLTGSFSAAFAGTTVTLTLALPGGGYAIKSGSVKINGNADPVSGSGNRYTFVMPAEDVSVSVDAFTGELYVKQGAAGSGLSWDDASGDLQKMMDEAAELKAAGALSAIVRVAAGTYTPIYQPRISAPYDRTIPSASRNVVFSLRPGVIVRGGYAAAGEDIDEETRKARFNADGRVKDPAYQVILSGDLNGDDNSDITSDNAYHVVLGAFIPADSGTVLDGFTITGGNADNGSQRFTMGNQSLSLDDGGGIHNLVESSPELRNLTISGNTATGSGGGMYNTNTSSPVLSNVTISDNSAAENGGGMFNNSSSPVLTGGEISGNTANNAGGGMYNYASSSPTLSNVTISDNSATYTGGGMSNHSSSPVLTNVTISGNTATNSGGGGMANYDSSPELSDVEISGNNAGYGGGMYNEDNSSPVLTGGEISGNTANNAGGCGMYNTSNSSPVLSNVTISGNSASNSGGGMLNMYSSSPVLTDVTISGNNAGYGGGMYNHNSSPELSDVEISGNNAGYGGGMYNEDNSSPVLTGGEISGNTANNDGGGMYNTSNSSPVLSNVTISGNTTGGDGGGMYTGNSSPELSNMTISGNTATSGNGGGMYNVNNSSPVLTNVIISGNTTANNRYGGGMYNEDNSSPQIRNSIIWGNTAINSCISNDGGAPVIAYSIVQNETTYPTDGSANADGNKNADPGFVDPRQAETGSPTTEGDYHLSSTSSPAYNAG
ncbi:MAG: right-handed parallel beta-helix repeat-containing protein, partial [Spirochaetales bacterium]|nr:right-handed parallel beta-helix repeat-containing protein [Spirochaetales bacterium]